MQERVDLQKPAAKAAPHVAGERVDPPSREVDFAVRASRDMVRGKDPRRKYVIAHGRDALNRYEMRGYQVEHQTADGPYVGAKRRADRNGTEITHMDGVLMSVARDEYEQIRQHGDPNLGDMGQKHYDDIERRIVRGGGVDPMRGQHGPGKGMRVEIQDEAKQDEG